ncbi:carbamoyltransferase family protein [Mucilaginibacter polytrichastri]|nr:carbamoyltransferase [Mucilaginibacter polytrichastri]SFT23894.1 carbamoyltransferase [Mucilaginibacter polytrichastri]
MYIIGISCFYHDSAACIIKDGEILAAVQEERFTRIKNDDSFPQQSIKYCLEYCQIDLGVIAYFVFYEKPFLKFERILETFTATSPLGFIQYLKGMPIWVKDKLFMKRTLLRNIQAISPDSTIKKEQLLFSEHHLSHIASAYYPSPFNDAVILTLDGVGEWATTSVALGENGKISPQFEIRFPHSLGLLYSAFTHYLGFKVNCDEFKVMGLAPYGNPAYKNIILEKLIDVQEDGSFHLNMTYFNFLNGLKMTNGRFEKLFGAKRRKPSETILQFHMDIAKSIQEVTEDVILKIAITLRKKYRSTNLCLAGGVALNCVANGLLLKESGFENIWIQPAAGDAGGALGAALYAYHDLTDSKRELGLQRNDYMKCSLLGPEYTKEQIIAILDKQNICYHLYDDEDFFPKLSSLLVDGNVAGWFSGRMEFGPRALGSRSIIADARSISMQTIINKKIKFRESFRPFAPAVLEAHADEYFELDCKSPYMLFTAPVAKSKRIIKIETAASGFDKLKISRSVIPAVTHVDYSARIQTVSPANGDFYTLIDSFYKLTGCPLLINTSFNVMDEPIVCNPDDALKCFLDTEMDILAFKNIIIYKCENR